MDMTALMNLLSLLIPLGMKVYTTVQQAEADKYKPIADVLAAADADWDTVIAAAQAELAKLTSPAPTN